ncbi:hypothetical protein [Arcobacter sp. CECT 8986]|uniref:hypothetical protein n=1 Tax=Arcobacter sp. CECT 8986 TaxID=2044507 RepID=UPI0013E91204|nr:hypothetical protein [Arcobacter sp. CECT 8986]
METDKIGLEPDESGFLFEIEDYNYLFKEKKKEKIKFYRDYIYRTLKRKAT